MNNDTTGQASGSGSGAGSGSGSGAGAGAGPSAGPGIALSRTAASRSRANTGSRRHHRRRRGASILNELAVSSTAKQKFRDGLKKKLAHHTELMRHLDMIVYVEICALYYMDCSLFRLIVRAAAQSFFLTPKPEDFVFALDTRRAHLFAVLVPNLLCLLLHMFTSLPTASEANRGYLHGGTVIDFIGQKAPASAGGLIALDIVVIAIQCLMLAVHTEREKLRRIVNPPREAVPVSAPAAAAARAISRAGGGDAAGAASTARPPTVAELDAEERGERGGRGGQRPQPTETADGIELQPRTPRRDASSNPGSSSSTTPFLSSDVEQRLRELHLGGPEATPEQAADDLLTAMASGGSIGDLFILDTMVHASRESNAGANSAAATTAQSLQTISNAVRLARLAAERRARAPASTAR